MCLLYSTLLHFAGKNFEVVCESCHLTLNKVMVFDDNGSITPGGVRIGNSVSSYAQIFINCYDCKVGAFIMVIAVCGCRDYCYDYKRLHRG